MLSSSKEVARETAEVYTRDKSYLRPQNSLELISLGLTTGKGKKLRNKLSLAANPEFEQSTSRSWLGGKFVSPRFCACYEDTVRH